MTEFLYDTVRFYCPGKYDQTELVKRLDSSVYQPQIDKVTGESYGFKDRIKNMRIETYSNGLSCTGSLPKFVHGCNVAPLSAKEIEEALDILSERLGVNIKFARITRIDIAYTFAMDDTVSKYLECLGDLSRHKRLEVAKGQTLNYVQGKNITKLSFYDKRAEMNDRSIEIPEAYQGKNLLRYEYRFHNASIRYLSIKFGTPIDGIMLLNESFHQYLVQKWLEQYMAIIKGCSLYNPDIHKMIKSPDDAVRYVLSLSLRKNGIEFMSTNSEFIDDIFKGNAQSRRRSREKLKAIYNFASSGEPCDLMKELTEKVQAVARRYNVK